MYLKILSAKTWRFWPGGDELTDISHVDFNPSMALCIWSHLIRAIYVRKSSCTEFIWRNINTVAFSIFSQHWSVAGKWHLWALSWCYEEWNNTSKNVTFALIHWPLGNFEPLDSFFLCKNIQPVHLLGNCSQSITINNNKTYVLQYDLFFYHKYPESTSVLTEPCDVLGFDVLDCNTFSIFCHLLCVGWLSIKAPIWHYVRLLHVIIISYICIIISCEIRCHEHMITKKDNW